jgi:hypothetical protein
MATVEIFRQDHSNVPMTHMWVDPHGNVLSSDVRGQDRYHWTEGNSLSVRWAGREEEVAVNVGEVPWPTLVALAAIRNVSIYRSLAAIPTAPGMLLVGFPDGTSQKMFFEELLPPGFADFIPGEDNGDRYGQEGEDSRLGHLR